MKKLALLLLLAITYLSISSYAGDDKDKKCSKSCKSKKESCCSDSTKKECIKDSKSCCSKKEKKCCSSDKKEKK